VRDGSDWQRWLFPPLRRHAKRIRTFSGLIAHPSPSAQPLSVNFIHRQLGSVGLGLASTNAVLKCGTVVLQVRLVL
jgi:hypothetical protein